MDAKYECINCGVVITGSPYKHDGRRCEKCNGPLVEVKAVQEESLSDNELYIKSMDSWIREQEARRSQLMNTIETSLTIVDENRRQLDWHNKRVASVIEEYNVWRLENGFEVLRNETQAAIGVQYATHDVCLEPCNHPID